MVSPGVHPAFADFTVQAERLFAVNEPRSPGLSGQVKFPHSWH
jgi:hypothetical protein